MPTGKDYTHYLAARQGERIKRSTTKKKRPTQNPPASGCYVSRNLSKYVILGCTIIIHFFYRGANPFLQNCSVLFKVFPPVRPYIRMQEKRNPWFRKTTGNLS